MDLHLATLNAVSFCFLHNVSTLNQCRKLSCGTVVCKHFVSYQGYPNYRWDLKFLHTLQRRSDTRTADSRAAVELLAAMSPEVLCLLAALM
jgi:hypothetical protein